MSGKMIILKSDDSYELADYTGLHSLKEAVNGRIELCSHIDLRLSFTKKIPCDLYSNESFLVTNNEEFNKINAIASLLSSDRSHFAEIRGNVVLLPSTEDGDNRGFEFTDDKNECRSAEETLIKYIKKNTQKFAKLHQKYDNNKSSPQISFFKIQEE